MANFALEHPPAGPHDDCGAAFWPTPSWVTQLLLAVDPPPEGVPVVEPSAGTGAIVADLMDAGYDVLPVEQREACAPDLSILVDRYIIGDWLKQPRLLSRYSIVGNPPYNPADVMLAHVLRCLEVGGARYIALLLPLAFACSRARYGLWKRHTPTAVYPLVERPAFGDAGKSGSRDVAWYVWKPCVHPLHPTNQVGRQTWRPLSKELLK